MNDERPFERLAKHAGPAEVDAAFGDRLYTALQRDMGRTQRSTRLAVLLVAALLTVVTVAGTVAVGSGLIAPPWVNRLLMPTASAAASEPVEPSPTPAPSQTHAWTATGDMTQARSGHTATLLPDGRVLVAGGHTTARSGDSALASAELYDPVTGIWTATGEMTHARTGHTATLLPDGRVLVAGGYAPGRLASAELYDPATGTWTATGVMTEPYLGHTATLLSNGTVLVAGGDAPSGPGAIGWAHADLYNPVTETWVAAATMVTPRLSHTATLLPDGRVLVSGGREHGGAESALFQDAELYDPATGRWAATAAMVQARSGHTATLLPNGTVLVTGGDTPGGPGAIGSPHTAELYDPSTGTWMAAARMVTPRLGHTATLLSDGRVLASGGTAHGGPDSALLHEAELYDPVTGRWAAIGNMTRARSWHAATLLLDGRVLVSGGAGSGSDIQASAELYDPSSGTR
jgi:N-acetylneuraminic acid mutarotase